MYMTVAQDPSEIDRNCTNSHNELLSRIMRKSHLVAVAFATQVTQGSCECLTTSAGYSEHEFAKIINSFIIPTMVFGTLSVFLCLWVMMVILAYRKDLHSMRERIILGLIGANLIFSMANALPFFLVELKDCTFVLTFKDAAWIRGIWLFGKFYIVCYEIAVVGFSLYSLKTGKITLNRSMEVCIHGSCFLIGLVVFTIWAHKIVPPSSQATIVQNRVQNAINQSATEKAKEYEFFETYTTLLTQQLTLLMRIWLGPLLISIMLWLVSRYTYFQLRVSWIREYQGAQDAWSRDLWSDQDKGVVAVRHTLFQLQKEAYKEIVKPLEPYVIVYVVFAIPAVVMTTDYCASRSVIPHVCSFPCEMVLSLRSLATAGVYLCNHENYRQLFTPSILCYKLRRRMRSCICSDGQTQRSGEVSFSDTVNVRLIDDTESTPPDITC